MDLADRVVVITGAGNGIGAAMARRFARGGARAVIVSDIDGDASDAVADSIVESGGTALSRAADATSREDLRALVAMTRAEYGALDLFCSNAGVAFGTGVQAPAAQWARSWEVNVMQHVHAAQAALPAMLRGGQGHLLITASGAGLLSAPGDAPYTVTKHAAIGLAEWLAITYRERGIRVSALCPLGVRTDLLMPAIEARHPAAMAIAAAAPLRTPEEVAESVVEGLAAERFLILPHASAGAAYAHKALAPDAWIERTVEETAAATGKRS
ncbi:short-subunit dehydrogenase [Saccharopolyspora erythraea NRRL 2338]|uniref:Oxidoreductase short-chain dehydrogenase/reductase family n=2 Tax=Saccharopolyspora erythraea TaxID=1836 RepID=A4FC66_SACEN|nr:SDR family oxidoreductase [Saccharopolyspora erythraea]EQD84474.1 dehydrogenase [Saccharopolyspora erythraea D]PFG95402.1 short-subunit dehydrogenase [Saccharopolyspora erythraea NRRL 2338]QRK92041.1 SDR family oxidoreductase [Saccharopolyspora erythraea]CAM01641.1 oxidoreductase short-chain dehydrogenase/reductase family [Saccharopolyspora erythraea NRRL 2338]